MEAKFNKIYEKQGFFDKYNGSIFATAFFLLVFFIIFSYSYIQTRITPIKSNWTKERCSPMIIPFAGIINPPPGKTAFEYTSENFTFCINTIIKEMIAIAFKPIEAVLHIFTKIFDGFGDAINDIRKLIDGIRSAVGDVSKDIMTRILNILIPFQKLMITAKATMGRAHASMVSGMYTSIGALWFMISGLLNVYNFIIALLVGLAASIALMWLIPFGLGIPEAIAMTAAMAAVSIPMGLIAGALDLIITITGVNQPVASAPTPSCFKKGTLIRSNNNTLYAIETIPLGTHLASGGFVTAVLKLDAKHENMYKLGNVTVSGSHKVLHNDKWIYVRHHDEAVLLNDFSDNEIYCLNTSKKYMKIGDYMFKDWDEVDKTNLFKYNCDKEEDIYKNLENGFHETTLVYIKNKGYTKICDVVIGDVLESGEKVIGTVKIKNDKPLYEYSTGFLGTKQFSVIQDLGKNQILSKETADELYHVLTDKGTIHIKEQKIMDYNWNIDFFNISNMYK